MAVDKISFEPYTTAIRLSEAQHTAREHVSAEFAASITDVWIALLQPNDGPVLEAQREIAAAYKQSLLVSDATSGDAETESAIQQPVEMAAALDEAAIKAAAAQQELERQAAQSVASNEERESERGDKDGKKEITQEELDGKTAQRETAERGQQEQETAKQAQLANAAVQEELQQEHRRAEAEQKQTAEAEVTQNENAGKREVAERNEEKLRTAEAEIKKTEEKEPGSKPALVAEADRELEKDGKTRMMEQDGRAVNGAALLAKDEPAREQEPAQLAKAERDGQQQDGQTKVAAIEDPAIGKNAAVGVAPTTQERIAAVEDPIVLNEGLLPKTYSWESPTGHKQSAEQLAFAQAAEVRAMLAGTGLIQGLDHAHVADLGEKAVPRVQNAAVAQQEFQASKISEAGVA